MFGVPHSLVTMVSWPKCHQKSYANRCGPRSTSQRPKGSKVPWSMTKMPPRPVPVGGAKGADVVRAAVARALVQLVWLYHLDDLRLGGVGLGVDDVDVKISGPGRAGSGARGAGVGRRG